MFAKSTKRGVFVLEGLNAAATSIYFNYIFFLMRDRFGFTNLGNLSLCALNGAVYCVAVWFAGKYAQRQGYFTSLRLGFGAMAIAMLAGSALLSTVPHSMLAQATILVLWTLGMSFTWPSLEALTSENEPQPRLQKLIGIYNIVWSTTGATAYFIGGALFERLGLHSIFLVPAVMHLTQLVLLSSLTLQNPEQTASQPVVPSSSPVTETPHSPTIPQAKLFLKMAWVANPFAYIAMNALIPVIPKLTQQFGLGPMLAGFFCSTWLFARSASFLALWLWPGWHYRFNWLIGGYGAMLACFLVILLSQNLPVVFLAQLLFGSSVGLIYYSSLYYSMDVGETKGEHGGFHEAAIGLGIFAGPAVGALSLKFFPSIPTLNVWAVAALLLAGAGVLIALWRFRE